MLRARRAHRRRDPLRRVRDADRRTAVHVAVDVGVPHRAVRDHHAGHRVGDQPTAAAATGVARDRASRRSASTCSPAPTCTSGAASCSRSRARCCSRVHIVYIGAYAQPCCRRSQFSALQIGVVALLSVAPAARAGRRLAQRARGVRGRVHRHRVLGGRAAAAAVGPTAHPRDARRAHPPGGAGVRRRSPGTSNGERLGAEQLAGAVAILAGIAVSESGPAVRVPRRRQVLTRDRRRRA